MKDAAVIIPIYKPSPSSDELVSIRQTIRTLCRYDIRVICPDDLDLAVYDAIFKDERVPLFAIRFNPSFFQSINGYNRLLLSAHFYKSLSEYEYILICQPDAFVFRDELIEWCQKGYDFIGAPLVENYNDTAFSERMRVGNGGFSLRNVQVALHFFNSKKNVFSPRQVAKRIALWKKPQTRIFVWIMMLLGWHNKPKTVADGWKYNEDDFWSGLLDNSRFALKKPSPEEAMQFSFERFPSELFKINGHKLPFGCHAWRKYEYAEFWAKYLPDSAESHSGE